MDIVFIGLASVICGGTAFEHMEDTGHGKLDWFKQYLELPHGVPDSDTFRRVFERIALKEMGEVLREVVDAAGSTVAVDGKAKRGSGNKDHSANHVVSAWVAEHQITPGQLAAEEKSNEITAIPDLVEMREGSGLCAGIEGQPADAAVRCKVITPAIITPAIK